MADTAAKLFDECPKCGGNGHWTPPPENTGNSMTYYSERACPDCDGLGMLLHQAVPGFAAWFGVEPEVPPQLRARVEATLDH